MSHSLDQKSNTLSRDVPHSTPEVEGNNGTIQQSTAENANDHIGSSILKQNVIASKLQILDGEKPLPDIKLFNRVLPVGLNSVKLKPDKLN